MKKKKNNSSNGIGCVHLAVKETASTQRKTSASKAQFEHITYGKSVRMCVRVCPFKTPFCHNDDSISCFNLSAWNMRKDSEKKKMYCVATDTLCTSSTRLIHTDFSTHGIRAYDQQ